MPGNGCLVTHEHAAHGRSMQGILTKRWQALLHGGESHGVENRSRTSGPGRRVACGSSQRNVRNVGWQKTAHMGISHRRTWKKHGWRSWRAHNSSTTRGTISREAERHMYGPQERKTKSSCLLVDGSHRQWRGTTQSRSMLGNLWTEGNNRCRYVEKMDIALCMEIGPQSSGGRHGYVL